MDYSEANLTSFYRPYFTTEEETVSFLQWIYSFDWNERIPRQMVHQVYRFVTLATRIDQIWPTRDGLRIVFIKTCMESLCHLSQADKNGFYRSFSACFSDKAKEEILSLFQLVSFSSTVHGITIDSHYDLTIADFLKIIKIVRDRVVHDGIYWDIQLFAFGDDPEVKWCSNITTDIRFLSDGTIPKKKCVTDYYFETSLYYDEFRYYFIEACMNYIHKYISKISTATK